MDQNSATTLEGERLVAVTSVPLRDRIVSLDVIRGLAVLGLLVVHIRSFAGPRAGYFNPTLLHDYHGPNMWVFQLAYVFVHAKMRVIFAMVFGAGVVLFARRAASEGRARVLWYRRMSWLLALGLVHAYFIWHDDILTPFALCGLLAPWWLRHLPARRLLIIAAVLLVIGQVVWTARGVALVITPALFDSGNMALAGDLTATPEHLEREIAIYRSSETGTAFGTYLAIIAYRAPMVFLIQTLGFLGFFMWRCTAFMLMGIALTKTGFLTAARPARFYAVGAAAAYAVGLPLCAAGLVLSEQCHYEQPTIIFVTNLNDVGSIAVALGHASAVLWFVKGGALRWLIDRLAAVGQMALTNYLLQSGLCTLIFYGYGLSLYGRLDYFQQMYVVLAVWIVHLWISPFWLRRFHYGPFEWAWRCLTYGRRQPMRRQRHDEAIMPLTPVASGQRA